MTAFAGHKVVDKGGYLKDIPTAERSVLMKSLILIALAGYAVLALSLIHI